MATSWRPVPFGTTPLLEVATARCMIRTCRPVPAGLRRGDLPWARLATRRGKRLLARIRRYRILTPRVAREVSPRRECPTAGRCRRIPRQARRRLRPTRRRHTSLCSRRSHCRRERAACRTQRLRHQTRRSATVAIRDSRATGTPESRGNPATSRPTPHRRMCRHRPSRRRSRAVASAGSTPQAVLAPPTCPIRAIHSPSAAGREASCRRSRSIPRPARDQDPARRLPRRLHSCRMFPGTGYRRPALRLGRR